MGSAHIEKRDRERIRGVAEELLTVRLDGSFEIADMLPAIREVIELESVGFYSVRNRTGAWEVDRWEAIGLMQEARPFIRKIFQQADEFPLYYNPLAPPSAQRNRVIEARAWIDQVRPGTWDESPMCRGVLRPLGAQLHFQPRALLCNGARLLGWFGGLHSHSPTRRQMNLLARLVEPMRQRLEAEERLREETFLRPVLDAALSRINAPAFVITSCGLIREANAAARVLLERDAVKIAEALRDAAAGRRPRIDVELVRVDDGAAWLLAIVKPASDDERIAVCIETCRTRWGLTPKQATVLAFVMRGLPNAAIAAELACVERTVELHVSALLDRADVDNRSALVAKVLTTGP